MAAIEMRTVEIKIQMQMQSHIPVGFQDRSLIQWIAAQVPNIEIPPAAHVKMNQRGNELELLLAAAIWSSEGS